MVKYVCEVCDEKFDEKEDVIEHETEGICIRDRLDLRYRAMNQSVVEAEKEKAEKYRKETIELLELYRQFTREEYVPFDKTKNMGFGLPIPVLSKLEVGIPYDDYRESRELVKMAGKVGAFL